MSHATLKQRRRSDYPYLLTYPTRWNDNDQYSHMNDAVYNSLFDSVAMTYAMEHCSFEPLKDMLMGILIELEWKFLAPVSFPDTLSLGLRVNKLGKSSVVFEVAVRVLGNDLPAAVGRRSYVYVDQESQKSSPMTKEAREGLKKLYRPLEVSPSAKL
ncbi:hypothetical protein AN958_09543 [Leucoagaricus sp. SymC.cos]|nr:hypothetical protein AN958_09543 [Leucoagaricus sp. SymC.cos]